MDVPDGYTDPITIFFDGFNDVLNANPTIGSLIRSNNIIRFGNPIGLKNAIQHGDLPEIVITPTGYRQEDLGTSGTCRLSEAFDVWIETGKKDVSQITCLTWELFKCFETFNASKAGELTYNGHRFIELLRFGSGSQAQTSINQNRGIDGWSAVWTFTVDMFFPISETIFTL